MRNVLLACVAILVLSFTFPADARMRAVEPGEIPELAADEGLVLVAADTNVPLYSIRLNKDGKMFGSGVMRELAQGRSYRLYVAEAGAYEWQELRVFRRLRYEFDDDPEFRFKVAPGRITYAGDLLFRPTSLWRAEVATPNRSLAAIDWLGREHAALLATHPFEYAGHYPDPFPAHYRSVLAAHAGPAAHQGADLLEPPAPGALPIPVARLWREGRVSDVVINPEGSLVAMQVRDDIPGAEHGSLGASTWAIELADMTAGKLTRIAESAVPYDGLQWAGNDALLVSMTLAGDSKVGVMRAPLGADGKRKIEYWPVPVDGVVIDPLANEPDHVLFQHVSRTGGLRVHRLDISSEEAVEDFFPRMFDRLNKGVEDDVAWFTDGQGRLRMAIVVRDDAYVLMHGRDGEYREVMTLSDEVDFDPVGVSHVADEIFVLTDEDRGQRDLVVYDIGQGRITRTLFSHPGVDVHSVIFDDRRMPIGVTHYEEGRLVSAYFDDGDQHIADLLAEAFPGRTIAVVDRSRDGSKAVLWIDAGDQPPQLYYLDSGTGHAMLLEDSMPWLADESFASTEVIRFTGAEGLAMEAFLTVPPASGKRPLVVMPHGGPVGIADRRHFDPEVQFLASLGYAVLRVNFRGSAGYGRAFREAGYGSLGTLIEDDIDAAIKTVVATRPVDPSRMCIVGASYGGYSALVGAMRWPERFRCVVSISGVSDRILQFTASDTGRSAEGRALLEKLMGDPRSDLEAMMATSPLYHHESITVPVMLVHGREDRRVDFEHTLRMARMLELAGRPATGLAFDGEGHGIRDLDNVRALWRGVAGFLRTHLEAAPAPAADAAPG